MLLAVPNNSPCEPTTSLYTTTATTYSLLFYKNIPHMHTYIHTYTRRIFTYTWYTYIPFKWTSFWTEWRKTIMIKKVSLIYSFYRWISKIRWFEPLREDKKKWMEHIYMSIGDQQCISASRQPSDTFINYSTYSV